MVVGKEKERIHIGPRAGRDGGADGAREVTQMRGSGSGNAGQDTGVHLNAPENPGGLAGEVVNNCLVRSRVFSDWKRVVSGKSVSLRGDLGGHRHFKKHNNRLN